MLYLFGLIAGHGFSQWWIKVMLEVSCIKIFFCKLQHIIIPDATKYIPQTNL